MMSPSRKSRSPLDPSEKMRKLNLVHKKVTQTAFGNAGVLNNYLKGFPPLDSDKKQSSPGKSRSASSTLAKLSQSVTRTLFGNKGGKKSRKPVKRGGKNRTHKKK